MGSTLQLLGRTLLALLVVVGLPQFAHADFIDLVSQSYLIHAFGDGLLPGGPIGPVVDYTETSDTPISRTDSVLVPNDTHPLGAFFLSTAANGGITPASAFVEAQSNQFDLAFGNAVIAEATAAITFRPLVSDVVVQAGSPIGPVLMGSLGRAGIYDLTAGAAVLALSPIGAAQYNVSLDLEHLYTIYASVSGPTRDGRLSILPTPESEGTLTFFVLGLGALLLVARSQKVRPSN